MTDYDFVELDFDKHVQEWSSIIYNGRTKSGKSTLMMWHAYQLLKSDKHRFSTALIFCPNSRVRKLWAKRVPTSWLHSNWAESVLQAEIDRRKRREDAGKSIRSMLWVADDCSYDTKFLNGSKALGEALKVGRNYKMFRMVACQWILDLNPGLREQFDYYVFPKTNQPETVKKIHKYYGGPIDTPALFRAIYRQLTYGYKAMVIAQNPRAEKATEEIFWTKAQSDSQQDMDDGYYEDERKAGIQIIGRDAYWALHHTYYSKAPLREKAALAPRSGIPIRAVGERRAPTNCAAQPSAPLCV